MSGRQAVLEGSYYDYHYKLHRNYKVTLAPLEPHYSGEKSVYEVYLDGVHIGLVYQRQFTRERKGKGMNYVYARWQSWGWSWRNKNDFRSNLECDTRKKAVEQLVRDWVRMD